jgi:hypothetical protein
MSHDRKDIDSEKGSQLEDINAVVPTLSPGYDSVALGQLDQKKLLRKIDLHVMPYTAMIMLLAFLDR